ncbi:hypothetical protein OH76DRAFT_534 [Lentinus brumalis]|uniref:Uncharacterized protein n=1 Tax=Lentinus brumalis TaxID=2498619 RepID=A0A371DWP9_9APHY|nr:hypothetical protein OH76DRAFT_534 [Polyporus brumalis]
MHRYVSYVLDFSLTCSITTAASHTCVSVTTHRQLLCDSPLKHQHTVAAAGQASKSARPGVCARSVYSPGDVLAAAAIAPQSASTAAVGMRSCEGNGDSCVRLCGLCYTRRAGQLTDGIYHVVHRVQGSDSRAALRESGDAKTLEEPTNMHMRAGRALTGDVDGVRVPARLSCLHGDYGGEKSSERSMVVGRGRWRWARRRKRGGTHGVLTSRPPADSVLYPSRFRPLRLVRRQPDAAMTWQVPQRISLGVRHAEHRTERDIGRRASDAC